MAPGDYSLTGNEKMFSLADLLDAHEHSSKHRLEILDSEKCGCFYCLEIFKPSENRKWSWVDGPEAEQSALCPKCEIDAVIGDKSGYPIDQEFLREMYNHWFNTLAS